MSALRSVFSHVEAEIQNHALALDIGCRQALGVTIGMFRTAKFAFYIATLATTVYLIEFAAVEPMIAIAFAVLLISGPEGLEAWLARQGALEQRERDRKQ